MGPGDDAQVFRPEQRLTLTQAMTAYTAESAWVNHLDDTGRVAAGALADLVVLDRDPFDAPAADIAATTVDQTYAGGRRGYVRQS